MEDFQLDALGEALAAIGTQHDAKEAEISDLRAQLAAAQEDLKNMTDLAVDAEKTALAYEALHSETKAELDKARGLLRDLVKASDGISNSAALDMPFLRTVWKAAHAYLAAGKDEK